MRKIEKQMLDAIKTRKALFGRNTMVTVAGDGERAQVYLHGNHIADFWYRSGVTEVNKYTVSRWPTVTTKSRLRALGVDIYTKKHVLFIDGEAF